MISKGSPDSSADKESACNAGDHSLIPGLGRSPGEGNSHLLQYSCLESSMDRGAWQAMGLQRVRYNWATHTHTYSFRFFKCWLSLSLSLSLGLPWSLSGKESTCQSGDAGSIPGWGDPLEKEMITHSSILAWKIQRTEDPGTEATVHGGVMKSRTQFSN